MAPRIGALYRLKANVGKEDGGLHLRQNDEATCAALVDPEEGVHDGGVVMAFEGRNWGCNLPEFDDLFEGVVA